MFERFTERARKVLTYAQEEARLLGHGFIGTEHILLGLLHEGEGLGAKALESLGISLEAVREKVEETIGPAGSAPTGSPPFTPRAKKVLELSLREALQLGHNYIGTEHLVLGLVREGNGVAAQVLRSLGADLPRVRQQVIQLLSGYQSRETAGPTAAVTPRCPSCSAPLEGRLRLASLRAWPAGAVPADATGSVDPAAGTSAASSQQDAPAAGGAGGPATESSGPLDVVVVYCSRCGSALAHVR